MGPGIVPPMNPAATTDWRKSAFDFAADSTKQLITVATGVIAATGLLSKDLDAGARHWAAFSWIAFTLSVLCGLSVLYNMSGQLNHAATNYTSPNLYYRGITDFSIGQLGLFLVGVVLMVFAFWTKPAQPTEIPASVNINKYLAPPPMQNQPTDHAQPNNPCQCSDHCTRHKKEKPVEGTPSQPPAVREK